MTAGPTRAALVALALLLTAGGALAQDDEAVKLREQLRSTVLQLRELQDQQAAAKAQAAPAPSVASPSSDSALKARLAAAQAQLRAARRAAADSVGLKAELDKARADHDALTAQAQTQAAELARFKDAFGKASDEARATAAERDRLQTLLTTQTTVAAACQAKNDRLVAFAEDLIAANQKITLGRKVAAREPVLGFGRVRLENLEQDREDAVRGARCDPVRDARPQAATAPAPAATPPPPTPRS